MWVFSLEAGSNPLTSSKPYAAQMAQIKRPHFWGHRKEANWKGNQGMVMQSFREERRVDRSREHSEGVKVSGLFCYVRMVHLPNQRRQFCTTPPAVSKDLIQQALTIGANW